MRHSCTWLSETQVWASEDPSGSGSKISESMSYTPNASLVDYVSLLYIFNLFKKASINIDEKRIKNVYSYILYIQIRQQVEQLTNVPLFIGYLPNLAPTNTLSHYQLILFATIAGPPSYQSTHVYIAVYALSMLIRIFFNIAACLCVGGVAVAHVPRTRCVCVRAC